MMAGWRTAFSIAFTRFLLFVFFHLPFVSSPTGYG